MTPKYTPDARYSEIGACDHAQSQNSDMYQVKYIERNGWKTAFI